MSDEMNVLNGGIDILNEIKTNVVRLDTMKSRTVELGEEQQKLEKSIAAREKAMETEISSTLNKRQQEIENSYDSQIVKTRDRIKMVKSKKDKDKGTKVDQRIKVETAGMQEEVRALKQDLKAVFTKERVSRIFNTDYFFSMFMPETIGDFIVILFTVAILLAVPTAVFIALPASTHKWWVLVLLYLAIIALGMALFMYLFKRIRTAHLNAFTQARAIRKKIRQTKKSIRKTEKSIRKDTDESGYGLESYDSELAELNGQVEAIIQQKKDALTDFENRTKVDISGEIKARFSEELEGMRAKNKAAYDEQRNLESEIKSLTLDISDRYESYVGKENLSVAMIDSLIDIINGGDALTIADAMAYYKKQLAEGGASAK